MISRSFPGISSSWINLSRGPASQTLRIISSRALLWGLGSGPNISSLRVRVLGTVLAPVGNAEHVTLAAPDLDLQSLGLFKRKARGRRRGLAAEF